MKILFPIFVGRGICLTLLALWIGFTPGIAEEFSQRKQEALVKILGTRLKEFGKLDVDRLSQAQLQQHHKHAETIRTLGPRSESPESIALLCSLALEDPFPEAFYFGVAYEVLLTYDSPPSTQALLVELADAKGARAALLIDLLVRRPTLDEDQIKILLSKWSGADPAPKRALRKASRKFGFILPETAPEVAREVATGHQGAPINYFGHEIKSHCFALITDFSLSMGPHVTLSEADARLHLRQEGEMQTQVMNLASKHELILRKQLELMGRLPETSRFRQIIFHGEIIDYGEWISGQENDCAKTASWLIAQPLAVKTIIWESLRAALSFEEIDTIYLLTDGISADSRVNDPDDLAAAMWRWSVLKQVTFNIINLGGIGRKKWPKGDEKAKKIARMDDRQRSIECLKLSAERSGGTCLSYDTLEGHEFRVAVATD